MITAMYKCWLICIIYFISTVHSTRYKGSFDKTIYQELSDNIDGYKLHGFQNAASLSLEKFENQGTSSVTIRNFQHLWTLDIYYISLQMMPKLENIPNLRSLAIMGNRIKLISRNSFSGLVHLVVINMEYNEIKSIANRAIPSTVETLALRCNKLTFFTDAWFQKPESVRTLDLSGNRIEEIQEGDFALLTTLNSLNLFNNRITTIGNAAFGYYSPMKLHLGYNNLSYISANMFAKKITMELFRIDYNRLSFLSDDLLKKINIKTLSIEGNPWQCPCLTKLEKRMPRIQILKSLYELHDESVPVCVVASSFANVCVPFIESELQQLYMDSIPTRRVNMCGIEYTTVNPLRYYDCGSYVSLSHYHLYQLKLQN